MQTPSRYCEGIDATRWHVLDAMADDWESPEQISKHFRDYVRTPIEPEALADLLEELFARNYLFLTLNTLFDKSAILAELRGETDDRRFWFGRAELGYVAWKQLREKYPVPAHGHPSI
jgi:hypothetical protein